MRSEPGLAIPDGPTGSSGFFVPVPPGSGGRSIGSLSQVPPWSKEPIGRLTFYGVVS